MRKKNTISILLGIAVLIIGTFAGVFLLNTTQIFKIGAQSGIAPKDIRVSNITDNSATISWVTDSQTSDFLNWGESSGSVSKIEKESSASEKFYTHTVTLSGLKPNTNYFYKINSQGSTFDNSGVPWQFTTGGALAAPNSSDLISGSVVTPTGETAGRALVYSDIGGYLMSALTSDTGNFVFQLAAARTPDLRNFAQIDDTKTLLQISVNAGPEGVSSVQIFPQSSRPIPPIILGQVKDYRNLPPSVGGVVPTVNLNLPANVAAESKFSFPAISGTPSPTSVIFESLKEGEIITTTKPSFFGRGPAGEKITITIQSDTITQELTIAKDGTWIFNIPQELSSGAHSATISWIDASGITRTVTRNFIIQASELPAFVATPSQTLAPSPSPSSSPQPVVSTPTPTASSSATPAPIPVTGNLTPTLILYIMGIAVTGFSIFLWKMAEV